MKDNRVIIMIRIFIIIMAVIGVKFFINCRKIASLECEIEVLGEEIKEAENKNKELKEELENLNDLDYIEKIARKKLGLVKPGEVLLIPVEEKENESNND